MTVSWYKDQFKEGIENINREKDEFKKTYFGEDEWNEGLGGKAWYPLKKLGETQDYINDQVNLRNVLRIGKDVTDKIPGKIDEAILDYSYKDLRDHAAGGIGNVAGAITGSETVNDAFELGAQVLLPDAVDFATGGVGYADNVIRAAKKFDSKAVRGIIDEAFNAKRVYGPQFNQAKEFVGNWGVKIRDTVTSPYRTIKGLVKGDLFETGAGIRTDGDGYINPLRQPEVPQVVRQALGNAGIREDGTFIYDIYKKNKKSILPKDRRGLAGLFMTDPMKGFAGKNMDQALTSYTNKVKSEFMKVYTPEFLAKYDIDASQLQLHHINALLGSLPLYDGIRYMSPEWMELTGTLLAKNVHTGNSLENLRFLVGRSKDFRTPHGITHKYLDEVVGPDGDKFFNALISHNGKSMTRLEYMKLSDANRMEVANSWADVVLKGNQITDQAVGVFNAINADLLNLKPENIDEIMSSLAKLQNNGLVKPELIEGRWQIGAEEMKELLFDIDFTENIGQHVLLADPNGLRALRIALQSDNPLSAYKAIKETLPKQLSLFGDEKVKILAKKSRRYNKKYDIPEITPESPFTDPGTLGPTGKRDW